MRNLNEIERIFYDSFNKYGDEIAAEELSIHDISEKFEALPCYELFSHQIIGPYEVDFIYDRCVIEIDGHDYHKTKEQRDHDYKRERYLQKEGYIVVRFMGTEIFLDAKSCVIETLKINDVFENKAIKDYESGFSSVHRAGD